MKLTRNQLKKIIRENLLTEVAPAVLGVWLAKQIGIMVLGYAASKAAKESTFAIARNIILKDIRNENWIETATEKFVDLSVFAQQCGDIDLMEELINFAKAGRKLAEITGEAKLLPDENDLTVTAFQAAVIGDLSNQNWQSSPYRGRPGAGTGFRSPIFDRPQGSVRNFAKTKAIPLLAAVGFALEAKGTAEAVSDAFSVNINKFNNDVEGFDAMHAQYKKGELKCTPESKGRSTKRKDVSMTKPLGRKGQSRKLPGSVPLPQNVKKKNKTPQQPRVQSKKIN